VKIGTCGETTPRRFTPRPHGRELPASVASPPPAASTPDERSSTESLSNCQRTQRFIFYITTCCLLIQLPAQPLRRRTEPQKRP
jgi:hypothetical protein